MYTVPAPIAAPAAPSASGASGVPPTHEQADADAGLGADDRRDHLARERACVVGLGVAWAQAFSPVSGAPPCVGARLQQRRRVACAPMSLVRTEDRGAVRHIVLNRPEKRNALNGEMIAELGAAIEAAAADADVRVVVLRGEGPLFSSGMDLNDLRDLSEDSSGLRDFRRPLLGWWNLLEEMPKPTICQIHGAALGGAFELALACDFRTMAEDAVAGIMEVRIGLLPDVGGCSRLPAVVGLGNAKELIMTGKVIDGREAHRIGFANRIAPPRSWTRPPRRSRTSCWPARRARSAWPSACWTRPPSRRSRSRSSRRWRRRRRSPRPRTSPRARAPSSRSATRTSPGASRRAGGHETTPERQQARMPCPGP